MLQARAIHNAAAEVETDEAGRVTVSVKTRRPWFLFPPLSWIVRAPESREARLDALGSEFWRLCDGTRTVEEVIDAFAESHGLTFHEARVSVTGYIKSLTERGVMVLVVGE